MENKSPANTVMHNSTNNMILVVIFITYSITNVVGEFKLLNVIFRHGDRAPDDNGLELYPQDPYVNYSFWPMGLGGLTNLGKRREYDLGEYLRENYGYFLGDIYVPEEVSARSTNVDRTIMSLQLVLASLYAPQHVQKWNHKLDWQPIPTETVAKLDDTLMIPEECPKYLKARERVERLPEVKAKLQPFKSFMRYLSEKTGRNISDSNDMYFLYHTLMAEKSCDLPLPEWTKDIFSYGRLLDGINLEYEIFSYNAEMKRLNGGMLLRKIIDDMVAYAEGRLNRNRKIFLYSGHETNVAAVLQALDVYYPHAPAYTSAVIIELHGDSYGNYYVKVVYYKGIAKTNQKIAKNMYVPGCYKQCSLDRFQSVLKRVTATDEDVTSCNKRSLRHSFATNKIHVAPGIIKQIVDKLHAEDNVRSKLLS